MEYINLFTETLNAPYAMMDNVIIKEIHAMVQMNVVWFLGLRGTFGFGS
jgi:hypothetical protein